MYDATGKGTGITAALEAYVQMLVPRGADADAKFDGVENALQGDAADGYDTFKRLGCAACHQGRGIGGNMTARFGALVKDPYADRGQCTVGDAYCRSDADCGGKVGGCDKTRHGVRLEDYGLGATEKTTAADAQYRFRVPSLRNIANTAPYFHDGSVQELPEAVRTMARLQLARELTPEETKDIVAFLEALTGKLSPTVLADAQVAASEMPEAKP
jgi:cytochrome c peroxidase